MFLWINTRGLCRKCCECRVVLSEAGAVTLQGVWQRALESDVQKRDKAGV